MKRITHLHYRHDKRQVVDQDGDAVPMKRARKIFDAGQLTDFNLAMYTLKQFDFDTDAVEAHYKECDGGAA